MSDLSCRLYLITPPIVDAATFAPQLAGALAAGDVACVLLRVDPTQVGAAKAVLKPLVAAVRAHDAAALIEDDTRLVGHIDADGLHLSGPDEGLAEAMRSMKPARIVGCGGLATRDDAMMAGEAGADYVMFGDEPAAAAPPFEERLERAAWWAAIFEIPCVAKAATLAEVMPLAATGVEFVALGAAVWDDPRGAAAAVGDAMAALREGATQFAARMAEIA